MGTAKEILCVGSTGAIVTMLAICFYTEKQPQQPEKPLRNYASCGILLPNNEIGRAIDLDGDGLVDIITQTFQEQTRATWIFQETEELANQRNYKLGRESGSRPKYIPKELREVYSSMLQKQNDLVRKLEDGRNK